MERNTNTLYILRFFAAIIVILHHFAPPGVADQLKWVIKNGGDAVTFFFFISGFVLFVADGKYFANNTTEKNKYKSKFYIKRIARIYPLYILAILPLIYFNYCISAIDTNGIIYHIPLELLAIQNVIGVSGINIPDWTISDEAFFYLIFPFAVTYMHKNLKKFSVFLLFYYGLSVSLNWYLGQISTRNLSPSMEKIYEIVYLHAIFLVPIFLIGILAGKLYTQNAIKFFNNKWNNRVAVVISISAVFIIKYFIERQNMLITGMLVPLYFVFVMAITSFAKKDTSIFNSRLFLFLGEISYCIYILQYPVYIFFAHYVGKITNGLSLCLYMAVLFFITIIAHFLVEKPSRTIILNWHNKSGNKLRLNG